MWPSWECGLREVNSAWSPDPGRAGQWAGPGPAQLFRHLHEIQSAFKLSSISFEILGFNSKGEVCNQRDPVGPDSEDGMVVVKDRV